MDYLSSLFLGLGLLTVWYMLFAYQIKKVIEKLDEIIKKLNERK
jgi:hypothetical protein